METLDDVLAHYGILGMKWGVRRTPEQLRRARGERKTRAEPSADAAKAREAAKKAKKGGVQSLSNQELQELTQRINLEQQYSRLTSQPSKLERGQKRVKTILGVGKTVNEAVAFANSPVGKQIAAQLIKKG